MSYCVCVSLHDLEVSGIIPKCDTLTTCEILFVTDKQIAHVGPKRLG